MKQTSTTAQTILAQAEATYPPTRIVLRTVCAHIGTAAQIADQLRLGQYGARAIRKWISYPDSLPFSVWHTILAIHEAAE